MATAIANAQAGQELRGLADTQAALRRLAILVARGEPPEAVFAVDAGGVESADAVLAVLDGSSVDDGTACEIGLFYGLKQGDPERKGVVGLLTDLRGERRGDFAINLFVRGCIDASGGAVVSSLDEALAMLQRWRSD